jgi:hypothetical protein
MQSLALGQSDAALGRAGNPSGDFSDRGIARGRWRRSAAGEGGGEADEGNPHGESLLGDIAAYRNAD